MVSEIYPTVEDVLRLGARGENYELIDGELIPMSPTNFEHADIELQIASVLREFVMPRRLGKVVVGDPLFRLDAVGRLARAPDVAFVSRERLRDQPNLRGAFQGSPDLAVEIVSPGNTADGIHRKVNDWLFHGTLIVLVVYPIERSVDVWRGTGALSLRDDAEVHLDPVLPGFTCKVSALFPTSLED